MRSDSSQSSLTEEKESARMAQAKILIKDMEINKVMADLEEEKEAGLTARKTEPKLSMETGDDLAGLRQDFEATNQVLGLLKGGVECVGRQTESLEDLLRSKLADPSLTTINKKLKEVLGLVQKTEGVAKGGGGEGKKENVGDLMAMELKSLKKAV